MKVPEAHAFGMSAPVRPCNLPRLAAAYGQVVSHAGAGPEAHHRRLVARRPLCPGASHIGGPVSGAGGRLLSRATPALLRITVSTSVRTGR